MLINESPLTVQPSLIRALGSPAQAIVLQQLYYWQGKATKEYDGHLWVYKTFADWGEETGLNSDQARRVMEALRKRGVVFSRSNPENKMDRRLWWRVDPEAVARLVEEVQTLFEDESGDSSASEGTGATRQGTGATLEGSGATSIARAGSDLVTETTTGDYKQTRVARVGGRSVNPARWVMTQQVLAEFNRQVDRDHRPVTSGGKISQAALMIYQRTGDYSDLEFEDYQRIIANTIKSHWWSAGVDDGEKPTFNVVFSPKVFENNISRKSRAARPRGEPPTIGRSEEERHRQRWEDVKAVRGIK
jgi:hypothetical protein